MRPLSRRRFLQSSFFSAAALSVPVRSVAQVAGANDDLRIAVIGFNSQGATHIEGFRKTAGARVVALCDVDSAVLAREAKKFADRNEPIATFTDVRRLLESKEIDAVSIATPNHWHALIAVWACQEGKDVYVEKPVSNTITEGRRIVEAARKYHRVVQTGTQSRSSVALKRAIRWLDEGHLGRIKFARGLCYKRRTTLGRVNGPQPIPSTVDYDLWCGPAPKTPLLRYRFHYDWHWFWNTGNGDIGNQGIHEMDLARWALGETKLSPSVLSLGGRFGYVDDGQTPNTQVVMHNYERAPLFFEVRGLPEQAGGKEMPLYRGLNIGVVIQGENGYLRLKANEATAFFDDGRVMEEFPADGDHRELHRMNFLDSVRVRDASYLNADIEQGHLSSALCHSGNISHRLGHRATLAQVNEQTKGQPDLEEAFGRFREHLAANEVKLDGANITLGSWLQMNPDTERFIDNNAANALLTREYRKGFAMPTRV